MKKGFLIFLMCIVSFLGINTVSAEEIYLEYEDSVNSISSYINNIGRDKVDNQINNMLSIYKNTYSSNYPYYIVSILDIIDNSFIINLTMLKEINYTYHYYQAFSFPNIYKITPTYSDFLNLTYKYDSSAETFVEKDPITSLIPLFTFNTSEKSKYLPYSYYYSNFNFYYYGSIYTDEIYNWQPMNYKPDDTFYVQNLEDSSLYSVYNANTDFLIEPYYLYDGDNFLKEDTYTTIDLNQYSYVALSLKDYNNIPENNSSIYTNILVKGQLCITPVYNYGMTERKDILTGTQVQRCSSYYNDFTSIRMYLLKTDVENHSIYYLKAYDTSKENIVKVDTSVFDITYITEDTKDNPYVSIGGKQYPTIAYDKLTDTATKSEDDDYISGVTCPVGDLNCYNEYNSENIFDSVFDSPLKILKNIWSSITSVFDIITEFISLLPETMQSFLFLSFMIAIILGIIKIIL